SSSKRLLLALDEAVSKLEEVDRSKSEPIAIIGMGCRFPGGANDPETFWQLLHDGVDAITEIPYSRWNIDDYYDSDPNTPGKMYIRHAGLLEQVDQFDPQFFGISPREALSMDPQQRLLLEVGWEALENAGVAPQQLSDSQTGVFLGMGQVDYARLQLTSGEHKRISAYDGTGNGLCFAAGRLSYALGLQGPSMAIDTACSSSLVAIHLACQSLRAGECSLALAAGVQMILSPEVTIFLSRAQALSPDGHCKTFDNAANGYGRGEGCGVIVLKRLHDAIANGDNILALIRGSAVNHDGPSSGFTVPNQTAQQTLLRKALANAKVKSSQVSYVEAHGTGTPLGDPIEVKALGAVLGEGRSPQNPLIIGSAKTNIGHLEAAAGIAGLIKVVLSLQNKQIPPHLHFQQPNPHINWDKLPVMVSTSLIPWHSKESKRLAGVSSFGMSGTNAHVILEEAPLPKPVQTAVADRPVHLLTLSAKTEEALKQLARRYENYLATHPNSAIADICFTANTGRSHFKHRLGVVATSSAELRKKLNAFAEAEEVIGVFNNQQQSAIKPKTAFLFTGQSSQYVNIGRELYETQPTFREAIDRCQQILEANLDKPLGSLLYPSPDESTALEETCYTQVALFAVEYALFKLWSSWGIKPTAVMGDSVGEYVAACMAGVFSLEDGLKLIAAQGRLMQALPENGQAEFTRVVSSVRYSNPRINFVSNLTGEWATSEVANAEYWLNHVQQPVQLAASIQTLHQHNYQVLLECGTKSALSDIARQCLPKNTGVYLPSLRAGISDWQQMLESLAELYVQGFAIDWSAFHRNAQNAKVILPTYPWQRQHYWVEETENQQFTHLLFTANRQSPSAHPLLGQRLSLAIQHSNIVFESQINSEQPFYLKHCRVYQQTILPVSAYVEMALAAGADVLQSHNLLLKDISFPQALPLKADQSTTLQFVLTPQQQQIYSLQIFSSNLHSQTQQPSWTLYACGTLQLHNNSHSPESLIDLAAIKTQCSQEISVADYYQKLQRLGLEYGQCFQAIEKLWQHPTEQQALAEIRLPAQLLTKAENYKLHPVLLDSSFQAIGAALLKLSLLDVYLPVGIKQLQVYQYPGSHLYSYIQFDAVPNSDDQKLSATVHMYTPDGQLIAVISKLQFKRINRNIFPHTTPTSLHYYQLQQASAEERQALLVGYLQKKVTTLLKLNSSYLLDPQNSLNEFGFDSLMGIELKNQIDSDLRLVVSPRVLIEAPNINEISKEIIKQFILRESPAQTDSQNSTNGSFKKRKTDWIVHYKPNKNACLRLFCFHHAGGNASLFRTWADHLPSNIEVFPVQLPGRRESISEQPFSQLSPLIKTLKNILNLYLDKPFAFYGHSLGSLISFELAHALRQDYKLEPIHLFVSGSWAPHTLSTAFTNKIFKISSLEKLLEIAEIPKSIQSDKLFMDEIMSVFQKDTQLFESYTYVDRGTINCPISAFGGTEDSFVSKDDLLYWNQYTSNSFTLHMLPGKHMFPISSEKSLLEAISHILEPFFNHKIS
ncbi:polyketide synthase dehydratase domain-containing protein, partial [Nostoc cf. edaphicum LEGE 07299]